MPKMWVKHVDADDISQFKVSLTSEADIDDLKNAIEAKLRLKGRTVANIYTTEDPINAIRPRCGVFDEDGKPRWDLLCYRLYSEKPNMSYFSRYGNVAVKLGCFLEALSDQAIYCMAAASEGYVEVDAFKLMLQLNEYLSSPSARSPRSVLPQGFQVTKEFVFPTENLMEPGIQESESIQYFVKHLNAVDSSTSPNSGRPSYLIPPFNEEDGEGGMEQTPSRTTRPDLTHRRLPLYLEWKGSDVDFYDVMLRMMERLFAVMCGNSLVQRSYGVVLTPSSAVLLGMERRELSEDSEVQKSNSNDRSKAYRVFVTPFRQEETYAIWKWLKGNGKSWWFHPQTKVVITSVRYLLGQKVAVLDEVGIKLLNRSSSSVYEILLPRNEGSIGKVLDDRCLSFALKINLDRGRFDREMSIVRRLTSTPEKIVFAGGWVHADGNTNSLSVVGRVFDSHQLSQYTACNSHCTDEERRPIGFVGGFIAMLKGIRVTSLKQINSEWPARDDIDAVKLDNLLTREKVVGIYASLGNLHAAGVCHCDIRPSNVLYFPHLKRYALIDYDLAVVEGSEVAVDPEGGQFDTAALVLNELRDAVRRKKIGPTIVKWTRKHDWKMVTAYCLERATGLTFSQLPDCLKVSSSGHSSEENKRRKVLCWT